MKLSSGCSEGAMLVGQAVSACPGIEPDSQRDEPLTRKEGGTPAWTDTEIDDVIAFLETLTDRDVVQPRKDR